MITHAIKAGRDLYRLKRSPIDYARSVGVRVGEDCRFLGLRRGTFGSEPYLVSIGDHVTVTSGVHFVTHEGGAWVLRERYPDLDAFARINVMRNCFIGLGAIILPGVNIGPDAIVAAGAVVNRDVPQGAIVAGTPARVVSTVEEFEKRLLSRGLHVRGLPEGEKRRLLEETL